MKALSLKQPYADLIVDGKKVIETRVWNTHFRGEFYVHASQGIDKEACARLGVTPSITGAIIGKAHLMDVKEYASQEEWDADREKHLAGAMIKDRVFGFILTGAERTEPVPAKGTLGFWDY